MVARQLKVFRTPIGFHDAYVAAPSRKAALEAWGSDHDLFARGVAELVTDPALTEEPLSKPGVVVKRLRGTADEQIAALPNTPKRIARGTKSASRPTPPRTPRPDRQPLEEAEHALAEAEKRHRAERADLRRREEELTKERRALEARHASELKRLGTARDKAEGAYETALREWRG